MVSLSARKCNPPTIIPSLPLPLSLRRLYLRIVHSILITIPQRLIVRVLVRVLVLVHLPPPSSLPSHCAHCPHFTHTLTHTLTRVLWQSVLVARVTWVVVLVYEHSAYSQSSSTP